MVNVVLALVELPEPTIVDVTADATVVDVNLVAAAVDSTVDVCCTDVELVKESVFSVEYVELLAESAVCSLATFVLNVVDFGDAGVVEIKDDVTLPVVNGVVIPMLLEFDSVTFDCPLLCPTIAYMTSIDLNLQQTK